MHCDHMYTYHMINLYKINYDKKLSIYGLKIKCQCINEL